MSYLELIRNERPDAQFPAPAEYVIRINECVLDGEGNPLLTKRCPSLEELDKEIDRIKGKLDEIKKGAHQRWG